ncbi:hypothetical protein HRbin36_02463 [bacterium HR36]|nr:hypothetical protein HRbin36_02463 [bacterium HR36]
MTSRLAHRYSPIPIDLDHAHAQMQPNAVLFVPFRRVEEDFHRLLDPSHHAGKQNAVIVAVWLVAEDGDGEAIGCFLGQSLDKARPCHAVADDD